MQEFLFVKDGGDYSQVFFSEILFIEVKDKYSRLITSKRKYLILQTLNVIEKTLPCSMFCRIHRSYIISLLHTSSFNNITASVGGRKLPIGKHYKGVLPNRVITFNGKSMHNIALTQYDNPPLSKNGI